MAVFDGQIHFHPMVDRNRLNKRCNVSSCYVENSTLLLGRDWTAVDVRREELHAILEEGLKEGKRLFGPNVPLADYLTARILHDERERYMI